MTDDVGDCATPLPPRLGRPSLVRRVLVPVAAGLVVVAVALAVIVWLPLDAQVEADVREAIVGYETSTEAAWPAEKPIALPLTEEERAALAADVERRRAEFATDEALAHYGPGLAVRDFAASSRRDWPWIVTGWRARIVYFDFVRQTLRGDVIVRAGVLRARQRRRMSAALGRLVAPRWRWDEEGIVIEYTLRDTGDAWKVVSSHQWGICGPNGEAPTPGHG
jgi:hypothetical protein